MPRPQEEINAINSMYEICKRNACEAKRRLRKKGIIVGRTTIQNIWKKECYEPGQVGGRRTSIREDKRTISDYDREQIIKAYSRYGGIPNLAAKSMRYGKKMIKRVWSEEGLEIKYDVQHNRKNQRKTGLEGKL